MSAPIKKYRRKWSCDMWVVIDSNVIPVNDLKEHIKSNQCWCNPDYEDGVYVHHSLDNRELTEELNKS